MTEDFDLEKANALLLETAQTLVDMGVPLIYVFRMFEAAASACKMRADKDRGISTTDIDRMRLEVNYQGNKQSPRPALVSMLETIKVLGYSGKEIKLVFQGLVDIIQEDSDLNELIKVLKQA